MAVVQISKIQLRRGQKNSQSGIPQLSSAEMAWAVDTQELFIGNGSVAEGAPYVGNTKILTEHDNLFDLAASYQFASNDNSITASIPRKLQSKLDEYVSVLDFGAVGDGVTNNTPAFEAALNELFNNTDQTYKKVLVVPNGTYLFTTALRIPSGSIIQGETLLGSILKINNNDVRFVTTDGLELTDFNSTNRPKNIKISNITISRTTGQLALSGIADSHFVNVNFQGSYILGNPVVNLISEPSAVVWQNLLDGISTTNVVFDSCNFTSNSISAKCLSNDLALTTEIKFQNCKFFVNHIGIFIDGRPTQSNNWIIDSCEFEEIAQQALRSTNGRNTRIIECQFKNVGNGTGTASNPIAPMVYFEEKIGNILVDCTSDRQQSAGIVSSNNVAAITEVFNADKAIFVNRNYSTIDLSDSFAPLAVFSAENKSYTINYFLSLGDYSRTGKLTLSVSDDFSHVSITDHYQYSPSLTTDPGGQLMTNFEFNATLRDNDGLAGIDTILLSYKNPLANGIVGEISFDVTYGV